MTQPATTGFAPIPWDLFSANNGELNGLPPAEPAHTGPGCNETWRPPINLPWHCCLPEGHDGTHRASNGSKTLAEWETS